MNKNLLIFAVVLVVLVAGAYLVLARGKKDSLAEKTAVINGYTFKLEVATTDPERIKGLSGRDTLLKDTGMLFRFDKPGMYSFWMKDMRFPIDIIFLRDAKVVTIYDSVSPFLQDGGVRRQNLTNYVPKRDSNQVLEINAGLEKEHGLKVGDTIEIKL